MSLVPNTPIVEDPGPPYLLFDLYPFDLGQMPAFDVPARTDVDGDGDADYRGGILKATDGTDYGYTAWFEANFKRMVEAGGEGRGKSWFIGGYHYLQFFQDGRRQADYYLGILKRAGWVPGVDIVPIVDVEFGGERAQNHNASTSQIIDVTTAFADRCREVTGRGVMLYGRGVMRDRGIASKMGCDRVWNPSYTQSMETNGIVDLKFYGRRGAWDLDDIVLWQHVGDGTGSNLRHKLPLVIDGFGHGRVDQSVYVDGARKPTLESMRRRLL